MKANTASLMTHLNGLIQTGMVMETTKMFFPMMERSGMTQMGIIMVITRTVRKGIGFQTIQIGGKIAIEMV